MLKKLSAAVLSGVMIISAAAPMAFAEDNAKEMEEVLVSVKDRINVPEELSEFESGIYSDWGETRYSFSWSTPKDAEKRENIHVNCTGDKIITSYDHYKQNDKIVTGDSQPAFPKQELSVMLEKAEDFIKGINPDIAGSIVIDNDRDESLYRTNYSFEFHREENGIPVNMCDGYLYFGEDNENVEYFNMNWSDAEEFPSLDNALSREDARKAFKEKLGMELVYSSYYDNGDTVYYPVYQLKEVGSYINAFTGEPFKIDYSRLTGGAGGDLAEESAMMAADNGAAMAKSALTEQEIAKIDEINGLITKGSIEKSVRANKTLNIPKKAVLDSIRLTTARNKTYFYYMTFKNDDNYFFVTADAKNGEIRSYTNGAPIVFDAKSTEKKAEISKEKADKILKQLTPSKYDKFEYTEDGNYVRKENGIKVVLDSASVSFDDKGNLSSYFVYFTNNASFPSIDGAMSADEAADKLFETTDYEMEYILEPEGEGKYNAVPVYDLKDYYSLNPFTGKPVDYRNKEIVKEEPIVYDDIALHYAKDRIEKLADYKIGFEGGKFYPDEKITQKDFITLVSKAFRSYYDEDDGIYDYAVRQGLIKEEEKNENAPLTREMAAVILIRAIGAEQYAAYEDIYAEPFKDVSEYKGYIGILSAMGIVEGDDDGNYNPKSNLSRAEAAIMIYNYLGKH